MMFKKMKKIIGAVQYLIRGSLLENPGKSHEGCHGKNSKACLLVYQAV